MQRHSRDIYWELREAQDEIARLRRRLDRSERRITELLNEKFDLGEQLRTLRSKPASEAQHEATRRDEIARERKAAHTTPQKDVKAKTEPAPGDRIPGKAFVPNRLYMTDRRHGDATVDKAPPNIREWTARNQSPDVAPGILNPVPWVVSAIPRSDLTYWTETNKRAASEDEKAAGGPSKRRRTDSKQISLDDQSSASPDRKEQTETDHSDRGGAPSLNVQPPTTNRLQSPNRRIVCAPCYARGRRCNFAPTCVSCLEYGEHCVWPLCPRGEACWVPRCPCLHPGEWKEGNGIVVE